MHSQNDLKKIKSLVSEIRDVSDCSDSVALAESLVLNGWLKIPPNRTEYILSLVADVRAQVRNSEVVPSLIDDPEKSEILLLCYAIEKALM